MLMALRFVLAWLFSARGRLLVSAAATAAVPAMSTPPMAAVTEQMHADEQHEKHHPYPVLR